MSLRPSPRTEVRCSHYKVAVDAEEGRRRREDNMVENRKNRREESLQKKCPTPPEAEEQEQEEQRRERELGDLGETGAGSESWRKDLENESKERSEDERCQTERVGA
ncbi:hypothetical protein Nepgr_014649 [Nepenthes gracilis]|uniref:IBB domain-containing protein n=1 Tax=Nepenthes gracilis TaxID=150966 RepID=A0AAD3XQ18_NEPGR|nr:hypothetical protein Nepgr_014649 [Nepenthes gracilis]